MHKLSLIKLITIQSLLINNLVRVLPIKCCYVISQKNNIYL